MRGESCKSEDTRSGGSKGGQFTSTCFLVTHVTQHES